MPTHTETQWSIVGWLANNHYTERTKNILSPMASILERRILGHMLLRWILLMRPTSGSPTVRNTGTEYAREIANLAFNIYIGDDPNPAYTYFVAADLGGDGNS